MSLVTRVLFFEADTAPFKADIKLFIRTHGLDTVGSVGGVLDVEEPVSQRSHFAHISRPLLAALLPLAQLQTLSSRTVPRLSDFEEMRKRLRSSEASVRPPRRLLSSAVLRQGPLSLNGVIPLLILSPAPHHHVALPSVAPAVRTPI